MQTSVASRPSPEKTTGRSTEISGETVRGKNVKKLVNNMNAKINDETAKWPRQPSERRPEQSVNSDGSRVISTCNGEGPATTPIKNTYKFLINVRKPGSTRKAFQ